MAQRWTIGQVPDLGGRVAVVTGANSGLGLEVTKVLAAKGARVLMACRNEDKARQAAAGVQGHVEVVPLDLASLQSVRALSAALHEREPRLDLLVNNAGLMAVDQGRTADGFETQFGVNHLGHVALTAELLPLLAAAPAARVVNVASMGHRAGSMHFDDVMFERSYRRWPPYFQSKLANLLFTAELDRRLRAAALPVAALAAHPGGSRTDLGTEGTGLTNVGMRAVVPLLTQTAARGAEPLLRAATDPSAQGGEFYGPRWLVRGHAVRETPSRRARSEADARRLWELSEELTGATWPASVATA